MQYIVLSLSLCLHTITCKAILWNIMYSWIYIKQNVFLRVTCMCAFRVEHLVLFVSGKDYFSYFQKSLVACTSFCMRGWGLMVFSLSITVVYYTCLHAYVELALHFRDEANLVWCIIFIRLYSDCKYFIEHFLV